MPKMPEIIRVVSESPRSSTGTRESFVEERTASTAQQRPQ